MTAEVIRIAPASDPDDILEMAKGQDFDDVVVIGIRKDGGPLWVSGSTSNLERVVFMLEWAKRVVMDGFVDMMREAKWPGGAA